MAWTLLLLMLLSHCTGSLSQPVLTQPSSHSASPGAPARLTCTLSSGFSVGDFWIEWYQQKPGSPPRYLLYYHSDSDKHQGSGVPSRFSGSNDASANAGILHISGLQPEDEADYYCCTWHGNSKTHTVLQTHEEVRQKPPLYSPGLVKSPLLVTLTKSNSGGGICCHTSSTGAPTDKQV
ncbi:PREDICTED: immunoglobulin omega chain-like [Mandrillus leucophaeus]|uniref:immunoglobulin omega chain-like n=1 Tax=Mandrillus leucophaeus TaxID=9568 RepID=UPI0005F577E9|nr:PREDICTED: immunoglobulin omega chain-like [Mandrillus leucophaeus]